MIGRLRGILVSTYEGGVCLDVGGVGYEVNMTPRGLVSLPGIGEEVVVHVHTHVREEELSLFGFDTSNERDLFRVLLGASGVGTKVGMAMLGAMQPPDIIRSIVAEDADALTVVPGIGKRTSERIIVELREKIAGALEEEVAAGIVEEGDARILARDGLVNLGYAPLEAEQLLEGIESEDPESLIAGALRKAGTGKAA